MTKTKKTANTRISRTTNGKRTGGKAAKKQKPLLKQARFHLYFLLLAGAVFGSVFAYRSLTARADSGPVVTPSTGATVQTTPTGVIYSGTFSNNTDDNYSFGYNPAGTLTATLSYSGVGTGTVNLAVYDNQISTHQQTLLTISSYGNPIVIQFNVAANTQHSFNINAPQSDAGSYTLTISVSPNNLPPTTAPFRSMPCSYSPVQGVFPYAVDPAIWPCPGSSTPSPNPPSSGSGSSTPPGPTPTPNPTSKDTTPPTSPTGLKATAAGPSNINLTWNASTDSGSGVAGYRIYSGTSSNNMSLLAVVTTNSYAHTFLQLSSTHYYYVRAFDNAGNTSGPSSTVSATTGAPGPPNVLILPSISIVNPKNGDTVSGIVNLSGVSGNTTIKSVQIEIDNNGFVSAAGTTEWDYKLNTRLYADTEHTITAKVTDSAGNSNTASIQLTFKNGSYPVVPPLAQGEWVSPEGMTIAVNSKGKNPHTGQPWTIADVYYMVKACAVGTGDFGTIAPYYKVDLNDQTGTWASDYTEVGIGTGNDGWSYFTATSSLNGSTGPMLTQPYDVSCYEYGHVWTEYYYHLVDYPTTADGLNGSDQTAPPNYLAERWVNKSGSVTLAQNNYCNNSIDGWDGCTTDDRRILFGGTGTNGGNDAADLVPGEPTTGYKEPNIGYINGSIIPPQDQPGLGTWYSNHWMTGE